MIREIVKIDRDLCNGCGDCIPNCHEGALQMIDGKATLVSELMCDGLGACLGHCPVGAITVEKREAPPYSEVAVIDEILKNGGKNVLIAHLKHLKEHNETVFLKEGVKYLRELEGSLDFNLAEVVHEVHNMKIGGSTPPQVAPVKPQFGNLKVAEGHGGGGCPGSREMSFAAEQAAPAAGEIDAPSELRQWPVQMHLINPGAGYFQGADVVIAADCVAFTLGNFHSKYLKGKSLAIACPKLDHGLDVYLNKLVALIDQSQINTLHVVVMEVPCCGGLSQMALQAISIANRKIPVKQTVVGIRGDILSEIWL